MCGPAAAPIVKGLAAVASNPAFMVGMNVLQWHQGEQVAKAGRRAARHDLTVSDANLLTREGAEAQSAEAEQDRIRREGAIARGAMLAGGVSRGIGRSMALNAMMQEYHSREADHMQGVANRRSQQRLASNIERGAHVSAFQNRMMANKGTGLAGLAMAVGTGAMQAKMASGMSPAAAGRAGYASGLGGNLYHLPGTMIGAPLDPYNFLG